MRHTIESLSRSWRLALLGAFMVLAAVVPASPAGADPHLVYSTYLGWEGEDVEFAVAAQGGNTFIASMSIWQEDGDYDVQESFNVTALGPSGSLFYSTYVSAGSGESEDGNQLWGIRAGPDGSVYVAVHTGYRGTPLRAFEIVKLNPSGERLWSTYSGGRISPGGMTVDSQGNLYVTGHDRSESSDPCCSSYLDEAFAWKTNSDGSFGYWTRIDGSSSDYSEDIAVDAAGNAYVLGNSSSTDLPKPILQPASTDGWLNPFVTKIGPSGSILWSTYLGGSGFDYGTKIRVAADGSVVVAGITSSTDFPTLNALQPERRGPQDLFLVRMKPWGPLISSTYLGGSGTEDVHDLAVDAASLLLLVNSQSLDSPLREPLDPACGNVYFVAKLDATASQVLDAACLGSSSITGIAADSTGVSLTGRPAADLPLVNAWQPSPAGLGEGFAAKLVLNHPPDCSAATASPATLWPADGRFVSVSIRGITDREGDRVTPAMTSIFQDEGLTKLGTPDATGIGASTARLRATRLNGGNGRVYHLSFTATDPRGGACTGTVKVCVPPAQGGTCVDGGARVDSTRVN